ARRRRGRTLLAGESRLDAFEQAERGNENRAGRLPAADLGRDFRVELAESVAAFEDEIDDCGRNRQLLLARQIKQRLQLVGERLDGRQIKKARAPLERVKRTENGIEYVHVRGIFLEDEYSLLDILQVLLGFVEELAEQFGVLFDIEHNYGL